MELKKRVTVFYFNDCEIVHYRAQSGSRRVNCVEFEVVGKKTTARAIAVLKKYEKLTGFGGKKRERRSVIQILSPKFL